MNQKANEGFIFSDYLSDVNLCDEIINYHKNSPEKQEGVTNQGVDKSKKDSIDVSLSYDLSIRYLNELQKVCLKYIKKFSFCDEFAPWRVISTPNVQHYPPGGGYKEWHCERGLPIPPFCNRHLAFMTYLNDVTDKGETEWYYQKIKIKPQKGLSVIWPVDWTHTHRGVVSPSQDKYIVTGWFNFVQNN